MTTVAPSCGPKLEALSHIDISKLSQSELHALSLCSDSAYDLRRTDDVVVPQIDRSLFNESAGSRRQTYSRLRHQHHRSRVPGLVHPSTPNPKPIPTSEPENHAILHFLKYFLHNPNSDSPPPPPPPPPPASAPLQPVVSGAGGLSSELQERTLVLMHERDRKRKRGRKPKEDKKTVQESGAGIELEIVNKNGEVIDFNNLENRGDELYSEELRKRTVGLKTEEEVMGYLRDLEGQWCSRRKKRKYVDASEFGDTLPMGWKLLLALRRRDGQVWIYCRRYVSPRGQQFISCKEASSFLRSHCLSGDANQLIQQAEDTVPSSVGNLQSNTSLVSLTDIQEHPHSLQKVDLAKHDIVAHSIVPSSSTPDQHENEFSLVEIDNLPDVKVQDLFECYKCNLTFDEKNSYLQHLFSFHQRTTKRYKVGTSVGDGVIIKDGKYECQFCHKVFDERRSYNGHVGVHVRNNARGNVEATAAVAAEKSVQSPPHDGLLSVTSKMDALIEIAQSSIVETSAAVATKASSTPSSSSMNLNGTMDAGLPDIMDFKVETRLNQDRMRPDNTCMVEDGAKSGLANKITPTMILTNDSEHPEGDDLKKGGNDKLTVGLGNSLIKANDDVESETMDLTLQENAIHDGLTRSSMPMVQAFHNGTEHPDGADLKKDGNDKLKVGFGNRLTKANDDVESETMDLTFQGNDICDGLTRSSVPMVQAFHYGTEHPEGDDMKKDANDKLAVGLGNRLTMDLTLKENATRDGSTHSSVPMVQAFLNETEHPEGHDMKKDANDKLAVGLESENMLLTLQENASQEGLSSCSVPVVQSFCDSTSILSASSKDNAEFSGIGQNLDNETGFEELRLDELEHFKYSFDVGHESSSLAAASIELGCDAVMEEVFESVGFDSGEMILNMAESHQLSTLCVWCRAEFKLEGFDSEAHSDSIGFMCPDCKAKISGHLDNGLSMSPRGF